MCLNIFKQIIDGFLTFILPLKNIIFTIFIWHFLLIF